MRARGCLGVWLNDFWIDFRHKNAGQRACMNIVHSGIGRVHSHSNLILLVTELLNHTFVNITELFRHWS